MPLTLMASPNLFRMKCVRNLYTSDSWIDTVEATCLFGEDLRLQRSRTPPKVRSNTRPDA